MDERAYWLGFSVFSGIGPRKMQSLLDHFGSAKAAWKASEKDVAKALGPALSVQFISFRATFSPIDYAKRLEQKHVWFLTLEDDTYPSSLKQIDKPPFVLYGRGDREILKQVQDDEKKIAVVGTRKTTQYGRDVTEMLTRALVAYNYTIVSGLAMGVDGVAHQTAIDNGGKTIAVLGCGVDCCTPVENQNLYDAILEKNGVILSEMSLGMPPSRGSFPARNRIVAGLSLGVLVTEGAEDSGALITADFGFSFGRKVFAVPGPITSGMSKGPYKLLAKGATLVTKVEDILDGLGSGSRRSRESRKGKEPIKADTQEEQVIIDLLANESLSYDQIVRRSGLSSSTVGSLLSIMEIKGLVKTVSGGDFSLAA